MTQLPKRPEHDNLHNVTPEYAITREQRYKRRSSCNQTALLVSGHHPKQRKATYTLAAKELLRAA